MSNGAIGRVIDATAWLVAFGCIVLAAEAHAQQCRTDADCESGFGCRKGDTSNDCDLPPSLPGADPKVPPGCAPAPMEAEFGECAPLPIACEADGDCPAGLTCHKERCEYTPIECDSDTDCDTGDACTLFDGEQTCSATPGLPCNGDKCAAPPEPTCTTVERRYCFPRRVDCATSADCAADRRCVALPEEIQEDAPGAWQGATRLCLSEGIALLVEGRIDAGGVVEESTSTRVANDSSSDRAAAEAERPVRGEGNPMPADQDTGSKDDCTVAAPGASRTRAAPWLFLCSVALGLWFTRRR